MQHQDIPLLRFGTRDQQSAYDALGANCGPGAIAGMCGSTPRHVISLMPEFAKRGATTEVMLTQALDALGVLWRQEEPDAVSYGILRVQWDGPWMSHPNPYEKLKHSHWVGISSLSGERLIFDINAISVGGWITFDEWRGDLVPWLLGIAEPEAIGGWSFTEGYELVALPEDG